MKFLNIDNCESCVKYCETYLGHVVPSLDCSVVLVLRMILPDDLASKCFTRSHKLMQTEFIAPATIGILVDLCCRQPGIWQLVGCKDNRPPRSKLDSKGLMYRNTVLWSYWILAVTL